MDYWVLVTVVLVAVAVWWWFRRQPPEPPVRIVANTPPPQGVPDLPGVPITLLEKIKASVDVDIPLVVTSGTPMQYADGEIEEIVKAVLRRINARGETLTLLSVTSASKTVDAFKTVAYEITALAFEPKANFGLALEMSVLVPVTNKVYIKSLRMANDKPDTMPNLGSASDPVAPAPYEDPLDVLASVNAGLGQAGSL